MGLTLALLAASLPGGAGCADDACGDDVDCAGTQICDRGQCVAPFGDEAGEGAGEGAGDGASTGGGEDDGGDAAGAEGEAPETGEAPDTPAVCPFPEREGEATLLEGLGTAAASARASFSSGGALISVDGLACAPNPDAPMPERFNPDAHRCAEAYQCDACRMWILDNADSGFLLAGDSEEACPEYAGFFAFGVFGDGDGDVDGDGGDAGAACVPACGLNEFCDDGVCSCSAGCRQGTVCCGGALCAGDCVGTPCCS